MIRNLSETNVLVTIDVVKGHETIKMLFEFVKSTDFQDVQKFRTTLPHHHYQRIKAIRTLYNVKISLKVQPQLGG